MAPPNTASLADVRGDVDTVVAAATYVEDHGFVPFGTLHSLESDGTITVPSDDAYEGYAPRFDPPAVDKE